METPNEKGKPASRTSSIAGSSNAGGELPEPLSTAQAIANLTQQLRDMQTSQRQFQLQTQEHFGTLAAQQRAFQQHVEQRMSVLESIVASQFGGGGGSVSSPHNNVLSSSLNNSLSSSSAPVSPMMMLMNNSNNRHHHQHPHPAPRDSSVLLPSTALVLTQGDYGRNQHPLIHSAPAIQRVLRFASRDSRRFAQLTGVSPAWHEVGRIHGVPVMRNLLKLQGESLFHRLCRAGVPWLLQHAIDSWKAPSSSSSASTSADEESTADFSTLVHLIAAPRVQFASALKQYYEHYVPERVSRVVEIVDRFEGNGQRRALLAMLQEKYGVLPSLPGSVSQQQNNNSFSGGASPSATRARASSSTQQQQHLPAPLNMAVILALDRKYGGKTAAMIATEKGHLSILRLVHASGGTLAGQNNDGFTCTMTAAFNGNLDVMKFLVQHGASVTEKNSDGFTPAILAAFKGHVDALRLIIAHGGMLSKQECRAKRIKVTPEVSELLPDDDESGSHSSAGSPDHISIDMSPMSERKARMAENPLDDL